LAAIFFDSSPSDCPKSCKGSVHKSSREAKVSNLFGIFVRKASFVQLLSINFIVEPMELEKIKIGKIWSQDSFLGLQDYRIKEQV
jgi:hypothetical protein